MLRHYAGEPRDDFLTAGSAGCDGVSEALGAGVGDDDGAALLVARAVALSAGWD
ncbi:hypothetical protein [Arthrobacter sp. JZ12]|uniref:hypothetical protein n=1 Tax=Arthrobacter sp. JZ12 TaxID=2654190 RepID=UPI002B4A2B83|nr:hypothetical protein [Arthrobacter sp. JZ12]